MMDYERGLEQLIQQARGTDWLTECALFEARLRENIDEERRYGTTEQTRADRARITDQLNRLTQKYLKTSFVDLCMNKHSNQYMEAASQPDTSEEQNRLNILIQNVPASQLTPKNVLLSSPEKVFVGYSHKDRQYLEELRNHLAYDIRAGKVVYWDDTEINPGAMWREEIKKALQIANMAVLLVSVNFLASDFIVNDELPQLLASATSGKMTILSVIVRPCLFNETALAQFQPVNSSLQPLSTMSRSERDKVWIKVAEYVKHNN